MRYSNQVPLTPDDVLQMLAGVLEYGFGEVRVVVAGGGIETVYVSATVKRPCHTPDALEILTKGEQSSMFK